MVRRSILAVWLTFAPISTALSDDNSPRHRAELIFPLDARHNHAPGIAELPDGELLVSWYRGSGERTADDVAVYGARFRPGASTWGDTFLMADTPGFPDCNTALWCDDSGALHLFWPVILANSWESCVTQHRIAPDPSGVSVPRWTEHNQLLLKPADFRDEVLSALDAAVKQSPRPLTDREQAELAETREKLGNKLYQRLGWQPRCKPTVLPSGRILLPLYTDTFSISLMAISDDGGRTWFAGGPVIGIGNIQPAVLRRSDGTLVAYMRENGFTGRVRVGESQDDGLTWGPVGVADLPNPGSGLDGVVLANGHWLLVHNDTVESRGSLAVSISEDEGRTWNRTRHLERADTGSYHYPAVIQARDGTIHCVYSYFVDGGKSMKHAAFNEAWVAVGD